MHFHPVVSQILNLLKHHAVWFEAFEHAPVVTSEEAANIRHGYSISQGAKALIVRVKRKEKNDEFVMIVLPGDERFNSKKVKTLLTAKDVSFATPEEVARITGGVQVGGVPPFGNLFDLHVYADMNVFTNEKIIFNAGDRRYSIAIESESYKKIVNPEVVEIV